METCAFPKESHHLISCWSAKIAREVEVMIVRDDRVERQLRLMEISALTAAHLCIHPDLMFYNGKVVVAADCVRQHSFLAGAEKRSFPGNSPFGGSAPCIKAGCFP
jgi:hypothetical protein